MERLLYRLRWNQTTLESHLLAIASDNDRGVIWPGLQSKILTVNPWHGGKEAAKEANRRRTAKEKKGRFHLDFGIKTKSSGPGVS